MCNNHLNNFFLFYSTLRDPYVPQAVTLLELAWSNNLCTLSLFFLPTSLHHRAPVQQILIHFSCTSNPSRFLIPVSNQSRFIIYCLDKFINKYSMRFINFCHELKFSSCINPIVKSFPSLFTYIQIDV